MMRRRIQGRPGISAGRKPRGSHARAAAGREDDPRAGGCRGEAVDLPRSRVACRSRPDLGAGAYFADHADELVILDEIHRAPGIFEALRGTIDRGRREGRGVGRFLLLGSAAIELLAQTGETLAGRIAYTELDPFDISEVGGEAVDALWSRGGFPESYLAASDAASLRWREDFIRTYLEREIPQLGPRIPAETLRRLWTMLAHNQGQLLNAASIARGLGVSTPTVNTYLTCSSTCSWCVDFSLGSPMSASARCAPPKHTFATLGFCTRCWASGTRRPCSGTRSSGQAGRAT